MLNKRLLFVLIAILSALSIFYAFYVQYYQNIEPCPLCIAERIIIGIIAILAILFAVHNPQNFLLRIYGFIVGGFAVFGIKVAAKHLWLISLPADKQPLSCGMPLDMLYKKIPLNSFISYILKGDGECSRVNWTILGISAPTAVIILCSLVTIMSLYIIFAKKNDLDCRRFY
ncbi:MAG: disulfide bond formation protein B [Proteobacteria bacterium]|jgi:disulfide bond formation protein DsbB|nr:disulfide bond formation protein B [Pseudomonadota bacterium]